ncbi:MAG: Bug family tripartite tricarboxylate transporter substrate binding protein, partial [Xanthobacteraceae bacterium]
MNRRSLFAALTSVAVLSLAAAAAAQTPDDYPSRPIRIIVPQAAGSGVDQQARVLAQKMGELWGQQGVVENRPGANAIVGMEAGAKAAPDGYTLIYAPVSAVTMNAFIYKKLSYDPLRDFVPITQTVANPLGAVVNPASGIKSIKDIVERAKANPGQLNYGSFGIGNMTHLMGVLLSIAADIKMTHVPYRGQTPAITDVLSGQIPLAFTTTAGVTDLVESGKLDLLATFGRERDEQFPNTPTPT